MKGIQLPVSNNATTGHKLKAAALTAYLSTLGFTKRIGLMWSRVRTHKGLYLRHPLDFDLRRYAVPPRLKEMLLSLENRHCMPPYFEDEDYQMEFAYIRQ
jgi:hypothetical protein